MDSDRERPEGVPEPGAHLRVALIVPTLDEEQAIGDLLARCAALRREAGCEEPLLVVADGGSRDRTREEAKRAGAQVVISEAGRGLQIGAGARAAFERGANCLVVVHADTLPPVDLLVHLHQAVASGAWAGGCLVRFTPAPGLLRFAAPLVNWRTRRFLVPLGDQLQWLTREAWDSIGGIEEWPILEDLDLMIRLRRTGRVVILPCYADTNARRFQRRGTLRTVVTNWFIWILFFAGVSPQRLRSLYQNVR